MTREVIRYEYQDSLVKLQELRKTIKRRHDAGLAAMSAVNEFVEVVRKIEGLRGRCPHPEKVEKKIFSFRPDCNREECADCGEIFKACECPLCRAAEEFSDPFRPG